jgi:hypothetical protein
MWLVLLAPCTWFVFLPLVLGYSFARSRPAPAAPERPRRDRGAVPVGVGGDQVGT